MPMNHETRERHETRTGSARGARGGLPPNEGGRPGPIGWLRSKSDQIRVNPTNSHLIQVTPTQSNLSANGADRRGWRKDRRDETADAGGAPASFHCGPGSIEASGPRHPTKSDQIAPNPSKSDQIKADQGGYNLTPPPEGGPRNTRKTRKPGGPIKCR